MSNNIFENIDTIIKGIVYFCLLLVAAILSAFVLYFVAMTVWRTLWPMQDPPGKGASMGGGDIR